MKVKFVPQNIELEIQPNQSVMDLAHKNGSAIKSVCNGMPQCAECRVRVVDGEYNVLPPGRKELNLIGTGYFIDQRRLSCQIHCFGNITVDLTEQMERANEGLVPKKFLQRTQKESAEDTHSVGGVLIEQDLDLVKQAEQDSAARTERDGSGGEAAGQRADVAGRNGGDSREGPAPRRNDQASGDSDRGEGRGRRRRGRRGGGRGRR